MRLKRVRVFGFKTFADRTDFLLEGGIIAVVGPNGCGKSNLVDAILWGLGEGNARQLRAANSQDVIFSGSSTRKGVGFTEVTLIFDNEDGALPLDSPEVSVSRRLSRSGESEYSINRRPCRLRDVHELLADSGLGRSGYAIVGQKEIDQALAASPEDRRAWVDEAAGVQRYRARKLESLKRLASAEIHLQRISDIIAELENQREPLREEAELAARYRSAQSSLRAVESGLLSQEIFSATQQMRNLDQRIRDSAALARSESMRAESLEEENRKAQTEVGRLTSDIAAARHDAQLAQTKGERCQADIRVCEERLRSLEELEATLNTSGDEAERAASAAIELEATVKEFEQDQTTLETLRLESAGAGEKARALAAQLKEVEEELAQAKGMQTEKLKLEAASTHRSERLAEIKRELSGIEAGSDDVHRALIEAKNAFESVRRAIAEKQAETADGESRLAELRKAEDDVSRKMRQWLSERSALEGRRRGVEATIEAYEGLAQGTRAVLEAKKRGILSGRYVPVAEAVAASHELALAIETALGNTANDLIVDDESDAKAAIAWLKEHKLGRATFQPIPLMRPFSPGVELRAVLAERGVIGRASDLVQCLPAFRPVIDSVLGRVIVVEDLDVALRLARTSGWSRLVSLGGEIVHSSGAVTGGHQVKQGYGLVQRKADLATLDQEIEVFAKKLAEAEAELESMRAAKEATETKLAETALRLKESRGECAEAESYYSTLNEEWTHQERSRKHLLAEMEKLSKIAQVSLPNVDTTALESRRDEILRAFAAGRADADQVTERLREMDTRVAQAEQRVRAARRRLEALEEDGRKRGKRLATIEPERAKIWGEIAALSALAQESFGRRDEADRRVTTLEAEKAALGKAAEARLAEARAARESAAGVGEDVHQAELDRARADARRAAAAQRLLEEYGLTEDDALEQADEAEVPKDAANLVARLRRELKAMGDVNLGAIEAYDRLTQRFDDLDGQRTDIRESIDQVQAGMRELDKLTRERFVSTFERLQEVFPEMLRRLFPGGTGTLSLSLPESVLDSGIEIEITLPGKRKQRLELLSGGERALCATAFLFSLLKVKPSPLVVLDEVDAPLDGRNVERFAELLREFAYGTQFIVITHNETTIKSAEIWLGVTMQEPGVSTLVPVRMPQVTLA